MTEEYYNKYYKNKTIKELCNQWRKYYIKKYKEWDDEKTVKFIERIIDEEICNLALSELLEHIKQEEKKYDKTN